MPDEPRYPSAASQAFAQEKAKPAEPAADAAPKPPEPVKNGERIKEAVAALHDELTALAGEHNFEVGDIHTFGLEFDVFDPVTGMLVSPARAHRRDVGDAGQLLGAAAVVSDIVSARQHQATAGVTQYSVDRIVMPVEPAAA